MADQSTLDVSACTLYRCSYNINSAVVLLNWIFSFREKHFKLQSQTFCELVHVLGSVPHSIDNFLSF